MARVGLRPLESRRVKSSMDTVRNEGRSNGTSPENISTKTIPNDHTSAFWLMLEDPLSTSGEDQLIFLNKKREKKGGDVHFTVRIQEKYRIIIYYFGIDLTLIGSGVIDLASPRSDSLTTRSFVTEEFKEIHKKANQSVKRNYNYIKKYLRN